MSPRMRPALGLDHCKSGALSHFVGFALTKFLVPQPDELTASLEGKTLKPKTRVLA